MRYCFDIDGTLCDTPNNDLGKPDYINAKPFPFMVEQVNRLYNEGNYIILMTARGRGSGIDQSELTKQQLKDWGIRYHELEPMFHKPNADIFVDDKGIHIDEWKRNQPQTKGIIAGAFDLIHPGYVRMFRECKTYCNHLTIALHENPSLERSSKISPIHSIEERKEILYSLRYIDDIVVYKTEEQFHNYLKSGNYNIRFLGDDYSDGSYTGKDIDIRVIFVDRSHDYSTTELKRKIVKSWR
jgi:glycerol-3-phosphate cytidylyltransferase-like family protein